MSKGEPRTAGDERTKERNVKSMKQLTAIEQSCPLDFTQERPQHKVSVVAGSEVAGMMARKASRLGAIRTIAAAIAVGAPATACSPSGGSASSGPIKIGGTLGLSGTLAGPPS